MTRRPTSRTSWNDVFESLVKVTPGARVARSRKLRPFSGRSTTRLLSITWPTVLDSVESNGASAVVITVSVICPTTRVTSTRAFWSTWSSNAATVDVRKLACFTVTE